MTLPRVTVPEVYRPAIAKIGSLPDESIQELLSAVRATTPALSPRRVAERIGSAVKSLSPEELARIISAVMSLSAVRAVNKIPISEFVALVVDSLKSSKAFGAVDPEALKTRLQMFLEVDQLTLGAKAGTLQRDHPAIFIGAHGITDIRPIFANGSESVQGAVVVHTLKLSYIQENEPRAFFIAMDDEDLVTLQKVLSRAEGKSKTLRSLISKTGLMDLDEG